MGKRVFQVSCINWAQTTTEFLQTVTVLLSSFLKPWKGTITLYQNKKRKEKEQLPTDFEKQKHATSFI